jgi:RNA polymerase sigma factor (sigma-70 family)
MLLAAFRRGDSAALASVYRTYAVPVERYLKALARRLRYIPCLAGSADLHQDTFERAFSVRARNGYDATREFGPYLMTIARNCFMDAVRRGRHEIPNAEMDMIQRIESVPRQESFRDPHVTELLEAYVRGLPGPLRSTFEQRFVFGHSQAIASGELGVTRRNLRTREEHLKSGLRRALQAEGMLRGDCW